MTGRGACNAAQSWPPGADCFRSCACAPCRRLFAPCAQKRLLLQRTAVARNRFPSDKCGSRPHGNSAHPVIHVRWILSRPRAHPPCWQRRRQARRFLRLRPRPHRRQRGFRPPSLRTREIPWSARAWIRTFPCLFYRLGGSVCVMAWLLSGKIILRIHRGAAVSYFKMQLGPVGAAVAHVGDFLTAFYHIPFLDVNLVTVGISTQKIGVMFDDDKLSVTAKSTSLIHDLSHFRRKNRLALLAGNVNAFVWSVGGIAFQQLALRRQAERAATSVRAG